MKISSIKLDVDAINAGDWIAIPSMPGVSLQCRGTLYAPYRLAYEQAVATAHREMGANQDGIAPDAAELMQGRLIAEHLLTGWKGFEDDDGTQIAYSPAQAMAWLTDLSYRRIYLAARYAAEKVGTAVKEQTEADAGN